MIKMRKNSRKTAVLLNLTKATQNFLNNLND